MDSNTKMQDPLQEQFNEMHRTYDRLLAHHIRRRVPNEEDVKDIVQIVWARAWHSLSNRGKDDPIYDQKAWLIKIANRVCSDKEKKVTPVIVYSPYYTTTDGEERSLIEDVPDSATNQPEVIVESHELSRRINALIEELPLHEQEAVRLRMLGWSSIEMVEYLQRAPSTVRQDVRRGIEHLRIRWTKNQQ